ncbi:MAG: phospho-sugar mutase, partial [Clostridia bacterium]|nr:phospho-sugar mutase [Clostridia bacterium]
FKYMADKVKELEDTAAGNYVLAYEESYGYRMGDHTRDKDGVVGALLLTEMAAWYRARGMTVLDGLQELWDTYGYYAEHTINAMFPGADGMERMQRIMEGLRAQPPAMIGEKPVCAVLDYRSGVRRDSEGDQPLHISGSDVLCFQLKAGGKVIVRPSGTEPKIKVYALVKGSSLAESENLAIRCAESARDLFVKI